MKMKHIDTRVQKQQVSDNVVIMSIEKKQTITKKYEILISYLISNKEILVFVSFHYQAVNKNL
jgi:hypothetical protein